jgi:hypothetical protein
MKGLVTIAALVGAANLSCGQGYIQFNNYSGSRFSTNTPNNVPGNGFLPAAAAPVGSYYFALFAAPSTQNTISTMLDPTLNGWTYVAIGTNTSSAGRLDGNNSDLGTGVDVPGFASGTTADFAVAGWSSNLGSSWAQAQAWWNNGLCSGPVVGNGPYGWFGINSTVGNDFYITTFGGPYNNPFSTGSGSGYINGWGLSAYPVPEPSLLSLTSLGAPTWLVARRRKRSMRG